ncbi:MAG: hypothetical protein H0X24_20775 [Ktedonobacterales bacterium]|nr:hypothetical protein [Ktedonobacterales bacterium]
MIISTIFVFFNCFAINMCLPYRKVGPWKTYLFGERICIILILLAKGALAWQIFVGTLRHCATLPENPAMGAHRVHADARACVDLNQWGTSINPLLKVLVEHLIRNLVIIGSARQGNTAVLKVTICHLLEQVVIEIDRQGRPLRDHPQEIGFVQPLVEIGGDPCG